MGCDKEPMEIISCDLKKIKVSFWKELKQKGLGKMFGDLKEGCC